MFEDFWGSASRVFSVFSPSSEVVSPISKGALSEVAHSFGEVGEVGEPAESKFSSFADILDSLELLPGTGGVVRSKLLPIWHLNTAQ
jgi:hypothetical protein